VTRREEIRALLETCGPVKVQPSVARHLLAEVDRLEAEADATWRAIDALDDVLEHVSQQDNPYLQDARQAVWNTRGTDAGKALLDRLAAAERERDHCKRERDEAIMVEPRLRSLQEMLGLQEGWLKEHAAARATAEQEREVFWCQAERLAAKLERTKGRVAIAREALEEIRPQDRVRDASVIATEALRRMDQR